MRRLAILFVLLVSLPAAAQGDWQLVDVVSGDALEGDPASGAARGQVKATVLRADARGGRVRFEVVCGEAGRPAPRPHGHDFECSWSFDGDVTRLASGQSIIADVSIRRTDRTKCRSLVEGAPIVDVLAGGPEAILTARRMDRDLDLRVFPEAPTPPLARRVGERNAAGESSGSLEVRVGDVEAEPGRRGFFNIALGSTLNATLHIVYVYEAVEEAHGAPPMDEAVAAARGALAASVGSGRVDPGLDLDRDGRVTSRDAVLVLQAAEEAQAREAARLEHRPGGPPPAVRDVRVPRLEGLTALDAKAALMRSRLEAVIEAPGAPGAAEVCCRGQSPEAGREVRRGSHVAVRLEAPHEEPRHVRPGEPPPAPPQEHPQQPPATPPHEHPQEPPATPPHEHPQEPPATPPHEHPQEPPAAPEMVVVPGVVGMKARDAKATLSGSVTVKFLVAPVDPPDAAHEFTIASQDPLAGTSVEKGSVVFLKVYRSLPPREEPEEPPHAEPEPPHEHPHEPPPPEPEPPHEEHPAEPPPPQPEPPHEEHPEPPPEAPDPFVGPWNGHMRVMAPGSGVPLGKPGEVLPLRIQIGRTEEGGYTLSIVGTETTGEGHPADGNLVLTWTQAGSGREMTVTRRGDALTGTLRSLTSDGRQDGYAEVQLKPGG